MASYFFDSSALVKLYHPEAGSTEVEALCRDTRNRVVVSRLTVVEVVSAFALKQRTQKLSITESEGVHKLFLQDVAVGLLTVVAVRESHYLSAQEMIVRYGGTRGIRTLDAIQLAVAVEAARVGGVGMLVAADRTLIEIARSEGLAVLNPEMP